MWERYCDSHKGDYDVQEKSPKKSPTKQDIIEQLEREVAERDRQIDGLHHENSELRTKVSHLYRENKFLTRTLRRIEAEYNLPETSVRICLVNSDSD
jgi:predicted RNase H-like nuclease (RuvC/YqgF family)